MIYRKIIMLDKSVYIVDNKSWADAIDIRLKEDILWIEKICTIVKKHWNEKTIPTKFQIDEPWEKEYRNHAVLAEDVMYPYLRAILMGIMMSEVTDGKGKVIALGKDGATEYPSGKKVKL